MAGRVPQFSQVLKQYGSDTGRYRALWSTLASIFYVNGPGTPAKSTILRLFWHIDKLSPNSYIQKGGTKLCLRWSVLGRHKVVYVPLLMWGIGGCS